MGYLDFEQSKNALLSVFNAVYDDTVSHTTNTEQADIYGLVAVRLIYNCAWHNLVGSYEYGTETCFAGPVEATLNYALIDFFDSHPHSITSLFTVIDPDDSDSSYFFFLDFVTNKFYYRHCMGDKFYEQLIQYINSSSV